MRIVHLSYYYGNNTSGAPVAATRLHQALLRVGVDSHFICVEQREPGVNIHPVPRSRVLGCLFYLVTRGLWVLSRVLFGRIVMTNVVPLWGFLTTVRHLKPDLVHLHLVTQDMVSFKQLRALACPVVVTLHDFSLVNALDSHPQGDRRFFEGFTQANSRWIERWIWDRKRSVIEKLKPVFSAPSEWAASVFRESFVGRGREVSVIPNLADPVFQYDSALRMPHARFTVIFGAYKGRSTAKGWDDLVAALEFLPEAMRQDMRILVFGESAPSCSVKGVSVEFLGAFSNPEDLRRAYHQADVCAFPSKMETQGQVKTEAMLCGLPVVVFDRTACAEGIGAGGWIAADGDLRGFADGLMRYYNLYKDGSLEVLRPKISAGMAASVSESSVVEGYVALYGRARERGV